MKAQMTQDQIYAFINESLDKLEKWRSEQLNLDAGWENVQAHCIGIGYILSAQMDICTRECMRAPSITMILRRFVSPFSKTFFMQNMWILILCPGPMQTLC